MPLTSGFQVNAPQAATLAQIQLPQTQGVDPSSFIQRDPNALVRGIAAGTELGKTLTDSLDPVAWAQRKAAIAQANATAVLAPKQAAIELEKINAEQPNIASRGTLEGQKISSESAINPVATQAQLTGLQNQIALNSSIGKFNSQGGNDKILQNKMTEVDNQSKELENQNKQIDLNQTKIKNDTTLAPQEMQLKLDQLGKDRQQLQLQQQQLDLQKNALQSIQGSSSQNQSQSSSKTTQASSLAPSEQERVNALKMKVASGLAKGTVDENDLANLQHYNSTGNLPLDSKQVAVREAKLGKLYEHPLIVQANEVGPALQTLKDQIAQKNGPGAQAAIDKFYQITNKSGVKINSGSIKMLEDSRPVINKALGKLNAGFTGNPFLDSDIKNFIDTAQIAADDTIKAAVNGPIKDAKSDLEQYGIPNRMPLLPTLENYGSSLNVLPHKVGDSKVSSRGVPITRLQ